LRISALLGGSDDKSYDGKWGYYSRLAAFCVSDNPVALCAERMPPSDITLALGDEGGVIGELLKLLIWQ
jgi:hypothetical protein